MDDAHRWMHLARRGELEAAWVISDRIRRRTATFGDPSLPRHLQPIWDGTPLDHRRVLVRCYHGLGDTIQFSRYLPELCRRADTVIVWAQAALLPLLHTLDADVRWLALHDGEPDADYDVDIEIMELPYAFRSTLGTIPASVPYLKAPPHPPGPAPRVGIVWRGGNWDGDRSIPFECLLPLFDEKAVNWYALQLDPRDDERHERLVRLAASPITVAAELTAAMDLVLSIDSMAAHLAGALAVPVWTLLRRNADWRWMVQRSDSPWYPTMRLFRQPSPGEWQAVVSSVLEALRAIDWSRQPRPSMRGSEVMSSA